MIRSNQSPSGGHKPDLIMRQGIKDNRGEPGNRLRPPNLLARIVNVEEGEVRALLLSFAYFFCLLCSYYILRPVREEMGIAGGVRNLQWVFAGTFLAMIAAVPIFGAAVARFPRKKLLPLVYYFFITHIVIFYLLFLTNSHIAYVAPAFFIWVSVFSLFVVSVFWSFMADLFTNEQARRLFGFIAAGGSAGAVVGSSVTAFLVLRIGLANLLLISALLLGGAVVCIHRLIRWADRIGRADSAPVAVEGASAQSGPESPGEAAIGGGILAGVKLVFRSPYLLGICLYILFFTTLSTFLYFEQAHIVRNAFDDPVKRTALFAAMNLGVNLLTLATQLFLTGRLVAGLGVPVTLALLPGLVMIGFGGLGLFPILGMLVAFQVVRRAGNFAIARPAREILFTVVGREEKYKSKNFIDTVVYRGGDAVSGWVFAGLSGMGLGLSAISLIAVPIAALWLFTGLALGKRQEILRTAPEQTVHPSDLG